MGYFYPYFQKAERRNGRGSPDDSALRGSVDSSVVLGRTGAYQRPSVDRSGGSADELQLFGREIIGDFYGSGRNSGKTEAVGNFSSGDDNRFGICKKVRTDGGQRCIT